MNRLVSLLHIFVCALAVFVRAQVHVEDTYVPAECDAIASPSDHVLIEFVVRLADGEELSPKFVRPNQLFHILLEQSDSSIVHKSIKGMCTNGTRIVTWENGNNINLSPLPISKNAFVDIHEEVSLEITVFHITPQEDYQIFVAFNSGNISLVMDLIDEHKGVNAVDEWGQSILMAAVARGELPVVAALLNTRMPRVNVNMAKPSGYTALFYSIQQPSISTMKALLRRGANPNARLLLADSAGSTPLHIACMLESVKHIELLLEYGADPTLVNDNGQYPLQMLPRDAVKSTKLYVRRLFEDALAKLENMERQSSEPIARDL